MLADPKLYRPLREGDVPFCWLDQQLREAAVNYWAGKCAPKDVKLVLKNLSFSGFHDQMFDTYAKFATKCGNKKKTVYVTGDSARDQENIYKVMTQPGKMTYNYGA